jgi:HNH endonuclease
MAEVHRLAQRELERLLRARGEGNCAAADVILTGPSDVRNLLAHEVNGDPQPRQHLCGTAVLLAEHAKQEVFGADVVALETVRFGSRQDDDLTGGICESLEQAAETRTNTARTQAVAGASVIKMRPGDLQTTSGRTATMNAMSIETTLLPLALTILDEPPRNPRAPTGAIDLPVDSDSEDRFHAKCAPFPDDRGHLWWLGAIDGGADRSGGYGRFQAGRGDTAVITTAHRFAWTLAHGPVPEGLVVRHRCDEPLCVALPHLELGTSAENNWDALDRPLRAADADTRGSAGRSRAIRDAVLEFLAVGINDSAALSLAVDNAMTLGDPDRFQLTLWPQDPISPGIRTETAGTS